MCVWCVCGPAFSQSECCSRPSQCADTCRAAAKDVSVYHGCCADLLLALCMYSWMWLCVYGWAWICPCRCTCCMGIYLGRHLCVGELVCGCHLVAVASLMRCMPPVFVYLCRAARSQPAGFVFALPLGHLLVVMGSGMCISVRARHLSWSLIAKYQVHSMHVLRLHAHILASTGSHACRRTHGHIPPFLERQSYKTAEHTAFFITQESTD